RASTGAGAMRLEPGTPAAHGPMTVYAAFAGAARRWPTHAFLCVTSGTARAYGIAQGEISYGDAQSRIDRLSGLYRQAGYGHGHRVGLLLENRPEFIFHWFALNALGVSVVPINAELRAAELRYLVDHSGIILAVAPS